MTGNHWISLTAIGALILTGVMVQSSFGSASARKASVSDGEILSYKCALSLATLISAKDEPGPLFAVGHLIFTSLETQAQSKILLVNAGHGNFAINLDAEGVNRVRFEIPASGSGPTKTFFLSYMHGGALRSRYFEFSEERPPFGHDELDYSLVTAHRAEYLLPHLNYAIHATAEATLNLITDGKLSRGEMFAHRVESCEHIARQSPNLSRNLRYKLDMIELIVMGAKAKERAIAATEVTSTRGPASVYKK